jgi:hypothetical protein
MSGALKAPTEAQFSLFFPPPKIVKKWFSSDKTYKSGVFAPALTTLQQSFSPSVCVEWLGEKILALD